jgi:protein TonB
MNFNRDEKKGLLFSVIFHILCCGLVGVLALTAFHAVPDEPIYDVALVAGGGDAAPEIAQPEPEPEPEIEEEIVKPREDDIVEKREKPIPKKVQTTQKPSAQPKYTSPGGTGSGSSAGTGGGKGGGNGPGIGPASDAIQAPAVPPRVTRSRMPSYPSAARSKGITGTAVVRFLVGKSGGVESVILARSSGDASLDQAALSAAGGFRFKPGLDGYGLPIRCSAYQPFAFRL